MDKRAITAALVPMYLLDECIHAAQRAHIAAEKLSLLRQDVSDDHHAHMMALVIEMRSICCLLHQFTETSHVHPRRVPVALNYVEVLLPCLRRTVSDIRLYLDDKTVSRKTRWRKMCIELSREGDLGLRQRFLVYKQFLTLLNQMVLGSSLFDLHAMERLQEKILFLRDARNIKRPQGRIGPPPEHVIMEISRRGQTTKHWAKQVFEGSIRSHTLLKYKRRESVLHCSSGQTEELSFPYGTELLFRRQFDNDALSVSFYLIPTFNPVKQSKRAPFVLGCHYRDDLQERSMLGVHELCIKRSGARGLVLRTWDDRRGVPRAWAALDFNTWEAMVLFHCSFISLKITSPLLIGTQPNEEILRDEEKCFQGTIIDDGKIHSLTVQKDLPSGGMRLLAQVTQGDQKDRPIWTAFVTHQSQSPSWLVKVGDNTVYLKDIQLYIFSTTYREDSMRQSTDGAFEIRFRLPLSATEFARFLTPQPRPPASVMHPEDVHEASGSRTPASVDSTNSESLSSVH